MLTLLVASVAHARLFTAPAPGSVNSQPTWTSTETAAASFVQPQVLVDVPVPQRSVSTGSGATLGVALVAAGLGVVVGHQAMLFSSGKSSKPAPKKAAARGRVSADTSVAPG